ncbi:MAG: ABC transporter ATP-binding protein [Clostridia bacterium]
MPMGGGPMRGAGAPAQKAKDFKGSLAKLIKYIGKYKIAIIIVMIFAAGSTVFAIIGPKILGDATTELFDGIIGKITGSSKGVDFDAIGKIILTVLGLYVISTLFAYIQGIIMTGISNKVTYRLRRDIDEKIHRMSFSYYDKTTNGEVLSKLTNDVDAINQAMGQSITQIITSVCTLVGIIVMMLTISWEMTLIAIASLFASVYIVKIIVTKSQKHFVTQQTYLGHVNGQVEEIFSCHTIVKAFNGEKKSLDNFKKDNEILYKSAWKANFFSGLMMPIMNFIGNLGYVIVCIIGGYLTISGRVTIGNIQSFIQYMRQFTQPIAQVAQISNVLQQTVSAAERVFGFLEETEEPADPANALSVCANNEKDKTKISIDGNIEFKDVSFGYSTDKIIINDFNAKIKAGQKIAIVGPTGAGKTTMVKLLMRFYDVTGGAILLDGHDIRDFKREELRRPFGMVLQETWLYNASIADNIKYGKPDATDEQIKNAAKSAQVHGFVKALPNGYDMILNEETNNISGGQKQLLTIARTILTDPKILILDEATSSVDTRTEVLIQKAMDNLMVGRTSFIIAHRLSTIKNADLILVMNNGDIVEQGSHIELLAKNGFYANLYNSQFSKSISK